MCFFTLSIDQYFFSWLLAIFVAGTTFGRTDIRQVEVGHRGLARTPDD